MIETVSFLGNYLPPALIAGLALLAVWYQRREQRGRFQVRYRQLDKSTGLIAAHGKFLETFLEAATAPILLKASIVASQ